MTQLVNWVQRAWRRFGDTQYNCALEAEVQRLREENRALMNSILGVAGIPPILTSADIRNQGTGNGTIPRLTEGANHKSAIPASPLRHPSWQQISKKLEIEAAGKKDLSQQKM